MIQIHTYGRKPLKNTPLKFDLNIFTKTKCVILIEDFPENGED